MQKRIASRERITQETKIKLDINLDGSGKGTIDTGIGFFDHMLNLFAFHGKMDLNVKADGDLYVCDHHTIEDIGIALGEAFKEAIGDKKVFVKGNPVIQRAVDQMAAFCGD